MIWITGDPQEDTSSSSETTPTSMSRKGKPSFSSRKTAKSVQNLPKRHVRSSSGYSSHNEETTFRKPTTVAHLIFFDSMSELRMNFYFVQQILQEFLRLPVHLFPNMILVFLSLPIFGTQMYEALHDLDVMFAFGDV
uniref:Uncharacterized protein n=1 Tax=Megaselia scalaris TaxID=36166 RepID=T1GKZ6_MEGSC